jgi:hypothetical protein
MKLWRGGKELEVKEQKGLGGDNGHSGLGFNFNDALSATNAAEQQ